MHSQTFEGSSKISILQDRKPHPCQKLSSEGVVRTRLQPICGVGHLLRVGERVGDKVTHVQKARNPSSVIQPSLLVSTVSLMSWSSHMNSGHKLNRSWDWTDKQSFRTTPQSSLNQYSPLPLEKTMPGLHPVEEEEEEKEEEEMKRGRGGGEEKRRRRRKEGNQHHKAHAHYIFTLSYFLKRSVRNRYPALLSSTLLPA